MGQLKIIKSAPGGGLGDTFDFELKKNGVVSDTVSDLGDNDNEVLTLEPGDYSIGEVNIPGNWDFEKVNCGAGDQTSLSANVTITSGQTTICTFTNKKKGQLKIIKSAPGGGAGDTFDFEIKKNGAVADTVTGLGDGGQEVLTLQPGDYTVGEVNIPGDWDFEKVNCGAGDKTSLSTAVTIVSGEMTTCTFTNTKKGQLKIIKNAPGGGPGDTFDFEIKKNGAVSDTVSDLGDNDNEVLTLQPGDYTVGEVNIPSGWDFTKVNCGSGDQTSNPAAVTVISGETITCTVTNTKQGKLEIEKQSLGGTGSFDITASGVGSPIVYTISTGSSNPNSETKDVAPGTYTISETAPNGWTLDSIVCEGNGSQDSRAVVVSGETTKCTVINKSLGSITIEKKVVGGNGETFDFTLTDPQSANITLAPSSLGDGDTTTAPDLPIGTGYTITEAVPPGWTLTVSGDNCSQNGNTAKAEVKANETTTCVFTNTRQTGSIKIEKKVVGGNGETFDFTLTDPQSANIALTPSSLGDGGTVTVSDLPTGAGYTITETVPAGWTLAVSGDNCSQNGNMVTAEVLANETTTCVFTNTRQTGDLKIVKLVEGGPTGLDFTFDVSGQPGPIIIPGGDSHTLFKVPTGNYTITETSLPEGWTLKSISGCGDVDLANNSVTLNLTTSGATCTFTNFKEKDDPAEDETKRFIHRRVDNLLTYGPDRARMLRRLQEQPPQQSLKDGPLKFSGGAASGSAGPMMAGRAPMGLMSSPPGLGLGSSSAALTTGTSGLAYTGPFKYDGVTYFENQEEDIVSPFERPATTSLFGELAGQLVPLASNGGSSFKFGTSLSEIRAAAAAAEADKERAKLAEAGLSFAEQPYTDRFATLRQGFDVWVEGHIAKYDDSIGGIDREGDFRILYVGADYVVAPGILVGALVQIDDTDEDIDDPSLVGKIEGTGWMVGPYIGIRLTDNLFFDARAAWGQSENDIALDDPVVGARSGSFDTDRWLASASLTGNEYYGPWRLSPQLQVAYGNEESDAYKTSLGQSVSSTEATIGRLTGTLEVGYRTELENGTMVEPHVAISGIWNFDTDDLTFNGTIYGTDETRAKIEGGILIQTPEGLGLRWAGSYDGLGSDDYDAYSGSLWVNIPLN